MNFHTNRVDADWIVYAASHSGEKKTIKAIEKKSGKEFDLANRTELWGRKKSKDGGFLAELNKTLKEPLTWEDFEIIDLQTPEPLPNVLHTAKMMVEGVSKSTGVKNTKLYVGEGRSFRAERATLLEYKGTRTNTLTPIYKEEVKEYLIKYHGAEVVKNLEVDDVVIIESMSPGNLVVSVDKDSMSCPVDLFNPMHPEWGIMNCRGLGKLWWDTSGKTKKLRGIGRKWLYVQTLIGDTIDNIKPNAASDVEFGEVSAFNAIDPCTTDEECFKAIKQAYQKMYPSPKKVYGFRGDVLEIDWLYVANEVFDLVRMKRSYDDNVVFGDVLAKYGLLED